VSRNILNTVSAAEGALPNPSRETGSGRAPEPVSLPRRYKATSPYCSRQGVPASVVKVPLFENQPLMPIDGPPKNQEKNANS
jgi:hypothetical protein